VLSNSCTLAWSQRSSLFVLRQLHGTQIDRFDARVKRSSMSPMLHTNELGTGGASIHIHSGWRDFDGDFGRDVLREHLTMQEH